MNKVNKMQITHITNAPTEMIIQLKKCAIHYQMKVLTTLIISDGNGNSFYDGISVIDVGKIIQDQKGFLKITLKFFKALRQNQIFIISMTQTFNLWVDFKVFSGKK